MASRQQRRQRREIERRLRELDRFDRLEQNGRRVRSSTADWRGRLAILLTIGSLAVALVAIPGLAPVRLRQAVGLGPHRVLDPVVTTAKGSYAFIAHQQGDTGTPVAWDPCRPIHYVINPTDGPTDALDLVAQAVSRAGEGSGLRFQYDGQTDARPHWGSPMLPIIGARKPVLVSWATASEVHQLSGDVAGIGGPVPVRASDGRLRFATGGVTLDADAFGEIAGRRGGQAEERAIILHELGHLLGLAHVSDPAELMNADNVGLLDYGPGDLAGLARLGRGSCF